MKQLTNGPAGYKDYIASPLWFKLRQEALERDGFRCRFCNASKDEERLEVHHRCYPEKWEDDCLDNLTTVCVPCHDLHTDRDRRKKYASKPVVAPRPVNDGVKTPQFEEKNKDFSVAVHKELY